MNKRIDLLNRDKFIDNVVQVVCQLSDNRRGCCFAIEGCWGIGKTFVVEGIEEKLRVCQSEEAKDDRFFVFHYNCWQHDYYAEPAIAIISAMQSSICEDKTIISDEFDANIKEAYEFVTKKLKDIVGLYLENKIGVNLVEWVEDISKSRKENKASQKDFDNLFNFSGVIAEVRTNLAEIAEKRTVVLIVDELDRCIPQYAIKVMERLHHMFYGLENVVVIMAIDRSQLEHSVEKMFGIRKNDSSMDVEKYLKKFIDFSMLLDYGKIKGALEEKYDFYFDRFFCNMLEEREQVYEILSVLLSEIDIRRQEKIIEKANIIHSIICPEEAMDFSVMVFEIMYEVFMLKKFTKMEYVVAVNDVRYVEMESILGSEKMALLKKIEKLSWHEKTTYTGSTDTPKKNINFNLYGKIMWYFANIFSEGMMPYVSQSPPDENINRGLEITRKYCQFCEIIQ